MAGENKGGNKKLTKKDMYNKEILDKLSDKQIMSNLIRLGLVDPKKQGFKMGGMAKKKTKYMAKGGTTMAMKKKTKYMAKGGMKKTKYMAKGGATKKTKYMAKGGATKRK